MDNVLTAATTTTMSPSRLSTTIDQEHCQQKIIPMESETSSPSISSSSDSNENEKWLSTVSTNDTVRSKKEIENDLFQNIELLVREFVNRPNCQFPYYRVMRWTTNQQPKIEDFVTVVINQTTHAL